MKVIFLNAWYAKTGKVFFDFVKENSLNTDIFSFQEVDPKLFSKLQELLPNHVGCYATENKVELLGYVYGEAIFVRKGLDIVSFGKINLFRQVINDVGYMQCADIRMGGKMIHLANIHGKARPVHKLDTPARLRQTKLIINKFNNKTGPKIIGGDFNLMPKTKSVRMFEEEGYKNLIKEFNIKDTRGRLNHRQFAKKDIQYFADYVFVSPEVKVKGFEVPNVEISDHLPLILDFEV